MDIENSGPALARGRAARGPDAGGFAGFSLLGRPFCFATWMGGFEAHRQSKPAEPNSSAGSTDGKEDNASAKNSERFEKTNPLHCGRGLVRVPFNPE
jgi:hypothetical protein